MGKIITDIDIANQALGYLGEQRISTMEEGTKEARAIKLHFLQCLEELIERHRWSFGRSRQRLTRDADAPIFGFEYSFQLPGDCLRVMDVMAISEEGKTLNPIPIRNFEIEGRSLHSDYPHIGLVYVKESISSDLPPLLIKALVLLLAARIAPALGESRMAMTLEAQADNAIQDAWMSDVRQSRSAENSSFQQQSREWMSRVRGISDHCCDNEYFPLSSTSDDDDDDDGGGVDPPDETAPLPVTGLTIIPGDGELLINWTASEGATSYVVSVGGVLVSPEPTLPTHLATGLTNGQNYQVSVSAKNEFGTSIAVTDIAAPVLDPPSPITGLTITPGDQQITIAWNESVGATSYVVSVGGLTVLPEPTSSPYVATGLTNGQDYLVSVAAKNAGGTSSAVTATDAPEVQLPSLEAAIKTTIDDALLLGGTSNAQFSTYDPTNGGGPVYVYDTNGYFYSLRQAITGWSPYNDDGDPGVGAGALLTPRHILTAGHNAPANNGGDVLHFVGANNQVQTVTTEKRITHPNYVAADGRRLNDIAITVLDQDLDPAIFQPAYLLPADWNDYLDPFIADQVPVLRSNKFENLYVSVFRGPHIDDVRHPDDDRQLMGTAVPTQADYLATHVEEVVGNSSSPAALIVDDYAVMMYVVAGSEAGHTLFSDLAIINQMIVDADNDGVSTPYTPNNAYWPNSGGHYIAQAPDWSSSYATVTKTAPGTTSIVTTSEADQSFSVQITNAEKAVDYRIYEVGNPIPLYEGQQVFITVTGLTNDQAYNIEICAYNSVGEGPRTTPITLTPFNPVTIPGDVQNVVPQPGDEGVSATWDPVSGADDYVVRRGGTIIATPTTPSFGESGLQNGTSYTYEITARNAIGESANPTSVTITPEEGVPGLVTNLTATPGDQQVLLSWDAVAGADTYPVTQDTVEISDAAANSLLVTGLTNAQSYDFTVGAKNGAGTSTPQAISATPAPADSFFRGTAAINSYMQIPSSVVTMDDWVELYAIIRSDDWTTNNDDNIHSTIMSGWQSFPMFRVRATGGYLQSVLSTSLFNTETEVSAMPQTSDWYEVRIRRIDSANWEYHYKVEGAATWVLAGTWANTTTDSDNTTLYFGSRDNNDANSDMGIKLVRYRSGTDENNLNTDIEIDVRAVAESATSFTATTGETVTVSSPGVITKTWT